jgi:diguanylate cyclase (GGDEF)-like protein/PAS domain S-box-containing protein
MRKAVTAEAAAAARLDNIAHRRGLPRAAGEILVVALFLGAALTSMLMTRNADGSALLWPANAIAASIMVRWPELRWGRVLGGVWVAGLLANLVADPGIIHPLGSFAISAVDVLEIGVTVYLFRFVIRLPFPNISFAGGVWMLALLGIALPSLGAVLGGWAISSTVGSTWPDAAANWLTASAAGAVLCAPAILLYNSKAVQRLLSLEYFALAAGMFVATYCAIRFSRFPLLTLSIPLIVVGFRVGSFGAALICAMVGFIVSALWAIGVHAPGLTAPASGYAGIPFVALGGMVISPVLMGFAADDRDRAIRALREERELLNTTLSAIGDAVVTTDELGQITYVNAAAENLIGQRIDQIAGRRLDDVVVLTNPQTMRATPSMFALCLTRGAQARRPERCLLHRPDGSPCYVVDTASPLSDPDGALTGVVVVLHDATAGVERDMELRHRAAHDPLTGLTNRFEFERRLGECYERYRHIEHPSSLLLIDLDRFKAVNDTSGHAAGDEVLRRVAKALRGIVRDSDTVSRLGGDEFALLVTHSDPTRAEVVGGKVLRAVSELVVDWNGASHTVGASIGLATLNPNIGGVSEWIAAADRACYEAKRAGRGQMRIVA